MKCLRCGYCCKRLWVPIVDDPALGPVEDNIITHEGLGTPCKHLRGSTPGKYLCAVHDEPWYAETPCAAYDQVGRMDGPCRIGVRELKGA